MCGWKETGQIMRLKQFFHLGRATGGWASSRARTNSHKHQTEQQIDVLTHTKRQLQDLSELLEGDLVRDLRNLQNIIDTCQNNEKIKRFHENIQNKFIFKTSFNRKDEVEALCFIFQDSNVRNDWNEIQWRNQSRQWMDRYFHHAWL